MREGKLLGKLLEALKVILVLGWQSILMLDIGGNFYYCVMQSVFVIVSAPRL